MKWTPDGPIGTPEEIIARLKPLVKQPDLIVVFSNGGFDDIHAKLLKQL